VAIAQSQKRSGIPNAARPNRAGFCWRPDLHALRIGGWLMGPASRLTMVSCEASGLPVVASSRSLRHWRPGVEKLRRRADFAKGLDHLFAGIRSRAADGIFTLAREYLPESMLAWKVPERCTQTFLEMLLRAGNGLEKATMEASFKSGNSKKIRY